MAMKYWPVTLVLNVSAHWESSERRKCLLMASASVASGWPLVAIIYQLHALHIPNPGTSCIHTEFRVVVSCDARIVDQKVDTIGLLCRKILCELNRTFLGRDVARKRMQATRASIVCLDCALKDLMSSSCDVYLRSVCHQRLCDHEANSSASSCDDGGDVGDIEERARLELFVGTLGYSMLALARIGCSNEKLTSRHNAFLNGRESRSRCCGC